MAVLGTLASAARLFGRRPAATLALGHLLHTPVFAMWLLCWARLSEESGFDERLGAWVLLFAIPLTQFLVCAPVTSAAATRLTLTSLPGRPRPAGAHWSQLSLLLVLGLLIQLLCGALFLPLTFLTPLLGLAYAAAVEEGRWPLGALRRVSGLLNGAWLRLLVIWLLVGAAEFSALALCFLSFEYVFDPSVALFNGETVRSLALVFLLTTEVGLLCALYNGALFSAIWDTLTANGRELDDARPDLVDVFA